MSHAIQKRFTSLEKGMDAPWGNSCCDLALYKIELNLQYYQYIGHNTED